MGRPVGLSIDLFFVHNNVTQEDMDRQSYIIVGCCIANFYL